jgi:hypothetical protein
MLVGTGISGCLECSKKKVSAGSDVRLPAILSANRHFSISAEALESESIRESAVQWKRRKWCRDEISE